MTLAEPTAKAAERSTEDRTPKTEETAVDDVVGSAVGWSVAAEAERAAEREARTRGSQPLEDEEDRSTEGALTAHQVAVVIPAYQAEQWIEDVASRAAAMVRQVVVVDDGSTDQTSSCAAKAGTKVSVERFDHNRGKGAALRHGFRVALADPEIRGLVTVDADGQHLPEEIPKLLAESADADLVLGSRRHLFGSMFWLRRMSNTLSSRGISFAAGCDLGDVQTGFRLYRRSLLEQVPLAEDRFEAESAVVVRAARRGFRIRSASVELGAVDGRSSSHYRPLADSLRIALAVLAARSLGGKR